MDFDHWFAKQGKREGEKPAGIPPVGQDYNVGDICYSGDDTYIYVGNGCWKKNISLAVDSDQDDPFLGTSGDFEPEEE